MQSKTTRYAQINVLLNSRRDSLALMSLWYMRKSIFPLLFIGLTGAMLTGRADDVNVDVLDAREVLAKLISPLAGIVLAFLLRILVNFAALIAAYPVLRQYEDRIGTEYPNIFSRVLDTFMSLRGLRALRWTHHVREQAMRQFDTDFFRNGTLNRYMDILAAVSFITFILSVFLFARALAG